MSGRSRLWVLCLVFGCGADAGSTAVLDRVEHCRYDVRVSSEQPLLLDVVAVCRGRGVRGLEAADPEIAAVISSFTSEVGRVARRGTRFELERARGSASFRYAVDVEALAARSRSIDRALRSGRSVVLPASSFLMHPLPLDVGIEVAVHVTSLPGFEFATGLAKNGDHYRLSAHEIPVATYAVFGPQQRRTSRIGAGELELSVLDGGVAVDADELGRWLDVSARAVAEFYGGFPVPRAFVSVVPMPQRNRVVFGKLLPESAPGIVLLVGADATAAELAGDWVLVHELFHLGVPSFYREGKWFDEGLATYFEPLLRVRAGLYTELELWREFARQMPKGLTALRRDGLERGGDYASLYWGGALFCFASDVAIRKRSRGRLGLEDGVRRVLARSGHASEVWSLADTLATADAAFPEPVLAPLAARHAARGAEFDLDSVFDELGVELSDGEVVLRDEAPSAWVRRAIVRGNADSE